MKYLCLLFVALVLFFSPYPVGAVDVGSVDKRIDELQQKIRELQGQENTLGKQIVILNTRISLTTEKISAIQLAIGKLTSEIGELKSEIDRLESLLTKRSELVLKRIPEAYKQQVAPQFGMIFFSHSFRDFVSKVKYFSTVQSDDAQLLFQLKATQQHFGERKILREKKKVEQEQLQKELAVEETQLAQQKQEKQLLLDQTKSSETVYQKLLTQSLAEKQALERALVDSVQIGPVTKGDPIALVGNSGYPACSTGAHLHFEVRRSGSWVNAEEFLRPKDVYDDQHGSKRSVGSGDWDWPLEGDVTVTQHYGKTPYSWRYAYSGGIHTGVDMTSNTSSVIRAPHDGVLYSSSQSCGASSIIKIKYIDHGGGLVSFFLHVQ